MKIIDFLFSIVKTSSFIVTSKVHLIIPILNTLNKQKVRFQKVTFRLIHLN